MGTRHKSIGGAGEETEMLAGVAGVARAAELLHCGALVAFPTETVYGLGANARDAEAVARIYAAKDRPSFNPLIVHVADLEAARALAVFAPWAEALAARFWPGPLTLVLPSRDALPSLVSAGQPTLALRVPAHPLAQALLHETGLPLAAPSANPSGRVSPTRADDVFDGLGGQIAAILDGGPCEVGVESTILGGEAPQLLRPGGVGREDIEAVLGMRLALGDAPGDAPSSPGQLASHYAPTVPLRLNATAPRDGETYLGFGAHTSSHSLSPSGDLVEAAAR
ncbi:MAG: L-threonylcarbamoyladenylate synthase, partial [Pseudomonadota bacterium]